MKKIVILLPVYNDWESLNKVLKEINLIISKIENFEFKCIVINDASSVDDLPVHKPNELSSLKIINMKQNRGHARCNAFGLRHIENTESYDYIIIMDSDGEDRPIEIESLIKKIKEYPDISVVAKRIKRSEGKIFQNLYRIHKLITLIFTGKKIDFGNYSCLTKKDVASIINDKSLWSSFSGCIKKNITKYNEIESVRGLRYFGPSKMSLLSLAIHSLSIIGVFKYTVFLRSTFLIIILSFLTKLSFPIILFLQILIILFNLLVFIASMRENKNALFNSNENILNEKYITH